MFYNSGGFMMNSKPYSDTWLCNC